MVDEATRAQRRAANPDRSTWLIANAGSGKTRVLTQRVARLLLAGVEPQRILCLTYTKAAASEMQNRLFSTLGEWTMLPRGALAEELANLGEPGPFPDDVLRAARTLFARAIETPGGLKIQTIHAFCAAILRRFPVEAGVSPDFREMDDRLATLLQREVLEELALSDDPGFAALAAAHTSDDLDALLRAIIRQKKSLIQPKSREELWEIFDLAPIERVETLFQEALGMDGIDVVATTAASLMASSANDVRAAEKLGAISLDQPSLTALAALEDVLIYGRDTKAPFTAKHNRFPTKAGKELLGEMLPALLALMDRMELARPKRQALVTAQRSLALHRFSGSFLPAYEAKKAQGGWLDFDDLIERTCALLGQSEMAQWVLYKLDGGVDHILVDEAQDTSPSQWQVIRMLADEFLSGEGARSDRLRTVFVVGDKKQSIYSFQGADPRAFDDMRDHFAERLSVAPEPLQDAALEFSFRSSPAILTLVDRVFEQSGSRALGQMSRHQAFKSALPGRVDVLDPWVAQSPERSEWYEAVDRIGETDHRRKLATDIAARIKEMLSVSQIPVLDRSGLSSRPVEPKDILILVQRRSEIFDEIIRACKAEGIPMAGADQLNVAQELAVRDITALLSFLATPEDDLALASVLKSPLFNWDERSLFDLAHHRTQTYLWPALRDRSADYGETVSVLQDMLAKADFLRPFELIERMLTWHRGRQRIYARLGPEAEDAVDALLAQALAYEQSESPSLTGFLTWLTADEVKIKRAIDGSANVVRVMTVHGSKGLEAPIVIMPDTAPRNAARLDELTDHGDTVVWRPSVADHPDALFAGRDAERRAKEEERQRLLYVAMTRAECWLIVAAAGDMKETAQSWYRQIAEAQASLEPVRISGGQRYEPLGWPANIAPRTLKAENAEPLILPMPAKAVSAEDPLSPSHLGGAKVVPGAALDEDALERGTAIHALLELLPDLPSKRWEGETARVATEYGLNPSEIRPDVFGVLSSPNLAHLFGSDGRAEVPITAALAELGGRRIRGSIDRLIIQPDRVIAVDFKSNRLEPKTVVDVPEGLLRQMGAYAAALAQIFPTKRIETALLWTHSARLMPLAHSDVIAALQRAAAP